MEAKPQLRKEDLLDWLFSENDDVNWLGFKIIKQLQNTGSAKITIQELFDECEYIPAHILLNEEEFDEEDEFKPSEVELIN
jgi:hypothetical protein